MADVSAAGDVPAGDASAGPEGADPPPQRRATSTTPTTKAIVTAATTSVPASTKPPPAAGSVLTANWKSQFHVGSRPWYRLARSEGKGQAGEVRIEDQQPEQRCREHAQHEAARVAGSQHQPGRQGEDRQPHERQEVGRERHRGRGGGVEQGHGSHDTPQREQCHHDRPGQRARPWPGAGARRPVAAGAVRRAPGECGGDGRADGQHGQGRHAALAELRGPVHLRGARCAPGVGFGGAGQHAEWRAQQPQERHRQDGQCGRGAGQEPGARARPVPEVGQEVGQGQHHERQAGVDVVLERGPIDARPGQPERRPEDDHEGQRQAASLPGGHGREAHAGHAQPEDHEVAGVVDEARRGARVPLGEEPHRLEVERPRPPRRRGRVRGAQAVVVLVHRPGQLGQGLASVDAGRHEGQAAHDRQAPGVAQLDPGRIAEDVDAQRQQRQAGQREQPGQPASAPGLQPGAGDRFPGSGRRGSGERRSSRGRCRRGGAVTLTERPEPEAASQPGDAASRQPDQDRQHSGCRAPVGSAKDAQGQEGRSGDDGPDDRQSKLLSRDRQRPTHHGRRQQAGQQQHQGQEEPVPGRVVHGCGPDGHGAQHGGQHDHAQQREHAPEARPEEDEQGQAADGVERHPLGGQRQPQDEAGADQERRGRPGAPLDRGTAVRRAGRPGRGTS